MKEKIEEMQKMTAELQNKLKLAIADMGEMENEGGGEGEGKCECCDKLESLKNTVNCIDSFLNYQSSRISDLWTELYRIERMIYQHSGDGHIPKLTASQMQKLLEAANLDGDFVVAKPTVYGASASKLNVNFKL